ncbi:hypothetical protein SCOR_33130 [Sulfidibacter corallicola]|uniref:Uncharacterized protein n=1 Tax=Sulfidibacter corallicola TaxID=2818388 RepID=A0A8A4THU4_SULCO|nr:hypothetical protein [Sulfidibacter corallicola]QTD49619.1 hypothetical protein J3U87_28870 [Sulfidibacter corallicola]
MSRLSIRGLSSQEEAEINRLLDLEEVDLYIELAQQLGTLDNKTDPEDKGKSWLGERIETIKKLICSEGNYCDFINENPNIRSVEIVAALGDLLSSVYGGLPVFTLASLLTQQQLNKLCECADR